MKVLYATRLFSGLETSFKSGVWLPTGVPTIYKLIEELDKKHKIRFIFSVKDNGNGYFSSWDKRKDCVCKVLGLSHSVSILVGIKLFPSWFNRKIAMIMRDIRQTLIIIREVIIFKPDIIYCDHASIISAAVLSRCQRRIPVVFRAMGVYPFMRESLSPSNIIHRVYRWAYKSPFSLVVCTQDGSGVELWLDNALHYKVKRKVLINGTDDVICPSVLDTRLKILLKEKNVILFVGKLERYKGCYEFIESIVLLLEKKNIQVHALVIGTGSEQEKLKKMVRESNNLDHFTFIDRMISEIYVSMNHLGNLSNANLEAIKLDDCMIMPFPQPDIGIDVITSKLLKDSVVYVAINNPSQLANKLFDLINSNRKRLKMSKSVSIKKQDFLWSWDERISVEISLLESLNK